MHAGTSMRHLAGSDKQCSSAGAPELLQHGEEFVEEVVALNAFDVVPELLAEVHSKAGHDAKGTTTIQF